MANTCAHCRSAFEVTPEDVAHFDKVSPVIAGEKHQIPPPTLCPDCRQQRRLTWRNERKLYHRTCDLTGKDIISCYSPDKPHKVYEPDAWNGDGWDPLQYGRDVDFNRPFFEQFRELQEQVPRIALHVVNNENSPYVNLSGYNKNCHLIFAAEYDEDCLYGTQVIKSRNCLDTLNCFESEGCYELVDCEKCYNLSSSKNCSNCSDALFLTDCKSCSDCLFCMNLRGKKFCIRNEQLKEDEYRKQKEEILRKLKTEGADKLKDEWEVFVRTLPHRDRFVINCENAEGDYLQNSRNLRHCFDLSYAEDCAYVFTGFKIKDLMDVCHTTEAELGYEGVSLGYGAYNALFTHGSWSSRNTMYCDVVQSCGDCFGCVSLRQKHHCILNKQYAKEDYEALLPKIIGHMQKTGEWGQFFPGAVSPYAYNETLAQEYYPLSPEEVKSKGWQWKDDVDEPHNVEKIIPGSKLPSDSATIPDDVLNWAIECEVTKRPFRIVKPELQFYRDRGLPLPHIHPDERHRRRMAQRNPRKLWSRKCDHCKKEIQTTYSPERPETVFCEECYLKEVY